MTTNEPTTPKVIEIRSIMGALLWKGEAQTMRRALERAVAEGADLTGADLTGADLTGADLKGADLTGADLTGAYLKGAYLTGADLKGADLTGAYLKGAYLTGADLTGADLTGAYLKGAYLTGAYLKGAYLKGAYLTGADLTGADLTGAYLKGAYLTGAYLTGAYLKGAYLTGVRDDLYAVLAVAKGEAAGLLTALRDGKVDGSVYTGECACLVGTIANIRGESYGALGIDLRPDSSRPAEVWFLAIEEGDTPANNPVSAITAEWIETWMKEQALDLPVHVPLVWRGDAERFGRELLEAGITSDRLMLVRVGHA